MNVKIQNEIPKSKTLNLFHGMAHNDTLVMLNRVLNLIRDLRISTSHFSFRFDLTLIHLWCITSCEL